MPTKRSAPLVPESPLAASPALVYFLMTGTPSEAWLPGWVSVEQWLIEHDDDREALRREAWPFLAAHLAAQARGAGFIAYGESGKKPRGGGVTRWIDQHVSNNGRDRFGRAT